MSGKFIAEYTIWRPYQEAEDKPVTASIRPADAAVGDTLLFYGALHEIIDTRPSKLPKYIDVVMVPK